MRSSKLPNWAMAVVSSHGPKGRGFNSWSGHTPRWWVQCAVGAHPRRQPIDLFLPHIVDVSLTVPVSFSLPSPLSKKQWKVSSGKEKKRNYLIELWSNNRTLHSDRTHEGVGTPHGHRMHEGDPRVWTWLSKLRDECDSCKLRALVDYYTIYVNLKTHQTILWILKVTELVNGTKNIMTGRIYPRFEDVVDSGPSSVDRN